MAAGQVDLEGVERAERYHKDVVFLILVGVDGDSSELQEEGESDRM